LQASGQDTVIAHSLYAIIGALAMEKGEGVAVEVAKQKILEPLGVRSR